MDESYMVYKRREAAAAKNREKEPESCNYLAGLLIIDDTEGDTWAKKIEKIVEDTEKEEILVEAESRKHSLHELGLSADSIKKHNSSTVFNNAKSERELELELKTRNSNTNKSSPKNIKSTLDKYFSKNRTTRGQAKDDNIVLTVSSTTIGTIQTKGRSANYPKEKNPLHSEAEDKEKEEENKTWEIAKEEACINKDVQQNTQNIKCPTRTKKRHKFIRDRKNYLSHSSDEENIHADNKSWELPSSSSSSSSAAAPTEKSKIKRKTTSKPSIITRGSVDDYHGSTKNILLIQNQKGQKAEKFSDHRNSSIETGKEIYAEKYIQQIEQDSEFEKIIFVKKLDPDFKKQIIPLSNGSLIENLAKAGEKYLKKENNVIHSETVNPCDFYTQIIEDTILRQRKSSIIHTESEKEKIIETITHHSTVKTNWFSWLRFFFSQQQLTRKPKTAAMEGISKFNKFQQTCERYSKGTSSSFLKDQQNQFNVKQLSRKSNNRITIFKFFRALRDLSTEFKEFLQQHPRQVNIIMILRNRCFAELIVIIIYCGLGAFIFRFTEGAFETFYKCGVKRVKRDFLDSLWNYSHNLREDDWKSMARRKLMEFEEQLHVAHEAGVHTYSGQQSWTFLNAVVFCLTVITTIGYGHIAPTTTTGRAITIVYAIFGIPMFLIILADFGKLFTRGIKFLWAFIRRLYYTGSCRKVRRTVPVQEVMKGVQFFYDFATFRRPSQMNPEEIEEMKKRATHTQNLLTVDGNLVQHPESISVPNSPGTPNMSTFAIDDEFNLPISLAISILLGYIFIGATLYHLWEKEWSFFESFYFVFISMSTIGFGDYVPTHPIYMMCSIVYLVFGLALTSMCINVVQVMLSDQFKHASQKIGATIGFEVVEDDTSIQPAELQPAEMDDVHMTIKDSNSNEQVIKALEQDVHIH